MSHILDREWEEAPYIGAIWLLNEQDSLNHGVRIPRKNMLVVLLSECGQYWSGYMKEIGDALSFMESIPELGSDMPVGTVPITNINNLGSDAWEIIRTKFMEDNLGPPAYGINYYYDSGPSSGFGVDCKCDMRVVLSSGCPKVRGKGECIKDWD